MESLSFIPNYQPIPLPAPVWMLKTLTVAGFYLHAIPMNVALAGGLVSGIFLLIGRKQPDGFASRLGNGLAFSLPFFVSFAITMGVVPLLFLQLIYGPQFYTSSIVMAWPWLMVIFLLLAGYYGYYIYSYRREKLGRRGPFVLLAIWLVFMSIAFFFSNNMTLMLNPQQWMNLYSEDPYGWNLNLLDPQLIPRYLHFVVSAIAVTGLTIGCFGLYWHKRPGHEDYGKWLIQTGALTFLIPTLLQAGVGTWFLFSLPEYVQANLLGGDPMGTHPLLASLVLDVVALVAMGMAWRSGNARPFQLGLVASLLVVALMVFVRHMVREYMSNRFFDFQHPEDPQWTIIAIFLVMAAVSIGYLVWLAKIVWTAFDKPEQPERPSMEMPTP